jgi:ATP-dependent RNA helicase DeaD
LNNLSFTDLGISTPIINAINQLGYETPTKIQAAAIPPILSGKDIAGQAQTGTGKTAAFAIPVLQRINPKSRQTQAIILCPTRELAVQVTGEFIKLARFLDGVHITPVYGGQMIQRQFKQLKAGTQIVVGTPGRVIDHLKRGTLSLDHLQMVVLDEADEMLNMGFREDIELILGYAGKNPERQTIMFSATISPAIKTIMKTFFHEPEMIRIDEKVTTAEGVQQFVVEARDSMRTEGICRLMDINNYKLALIFCNTKRGCDELVSDMQARGYASDALHGDMSQAVRDKVMNKFRQGHIEVLIATDVAARGLDVENVDVVFNFDIPHDPEYYVHRIGRTGRAGKTGAAYTFASGRKMRSIEFIERKIRTRIETIPLPSIKQVEVSRVNAFIDDITQTLETGGLRPYIEQIEAIATDRFTPIEVAAALLKIRDSRQMLTSAPQEDTGYSASESFEPQKPRKKKSYGSKNKKRESEPFYARFAKDKGRKKSKR